MSTLLLEGELGKCPAFQHQEMLGIGVSPQRPVRLSHELPSLELIALTVNW